MPLPKFNFIFPRLGDAKNKFLVSNQMREGVWWPLWIGCELIEIQWKNPFCCVRSCSCSRSGRYGLGLCFWVVNGYRHHFARLLEFLSSSSSACVIHFSFELFSRCYVHVRSDSAKFCLLVINLGLEPWAAVYFTPFMFWFAPGAFGQPQVFVPAAILDFCRCLAWVERCPGPIYLQHATGGAPGSNFVFTNNFCLCTGQGSIFHLECHCSYSRVLVSLRPARLKLQVPVSAVLSLLKNLVAVRRSALVWVWIILGWSRYYS
jgi:hypothetical protein